MVYNGFVGIWCDAAPGGLFWKTLVKGEMASEEAAELGLVDQASPLTSAELMGSWGEMG